MTKYFYFFMMVFVALPTFAQETFTLTSPGLGGVGTNKEVFNGFGCEGENTSPMLKWTNAPEGTKSFAITMYDKNAPTGSGWWHWLVFNISSDTKMLPANAGDITSGLMPKGAIQSLTDFGGYGYGGPCPPKGHGYHQYMITIYALDVDKLDLDKDSSPAKVGYNLHGHTIEKASVVFYYQR